MFLTAVTWLRIVLVPVVMALVLAGPDTRYAFAVAAALFAIAAITDFVDVASRDDGPKASTLGASSTRPRTSFVSGALLALVAVDRASPWLALIIVGRELLIMGLRGAVAAGGDLVRRRSGARRRRTQFLAIFLAIVRPLAPARCSSTST